MIRLLICFAVALFLLCWTMVLFAAKMTAAAIVVLAVSLLLLVSGGKRV